MNRPRPEGPTHSDQEALAEPDLSDRLDRALESLWGGSSDDLDALIGQISRERDSFDLVAGVRTVSRLAGERPAVDSIEGFQILDELGRGGMGVVYKARQEKPARDVAIKVIRRSRASESDLRRFQYEADTLASLNHPSIAKIHQAGFFDDRGEQVPYLVMEFVDGRSLNRYIEEANPTLPQRLELIASVCEAIHHAHQRGVIHRDIKPDNVLIDASGLPRVVDFGVARPVERTGEDLTVATTGHALIGTLRYMSPEQVDPRIGTLDIRSDVYALAVILYEVVVGKPPYDLSSDSPAQIISAIAHGVCPASQQLKPDLDPDLRVIIETAGSADPAERYPSAEAMAADIRRFLRHEPILAGPRGRLYVARKFVQRNPGLAAVSALLIAALITFSATISVLYSRSSEARASEATQRQIAEEELARSEQVLTFVQNMLEGIDPATARSMDRTLLQMILDQAAGRVESELSGQPKAAASLHATIGRSYHTIGELEQARLHFDASLDLYRQHFGVDDERTIMVAGALGSVLKDRAEYEEAEELLLWAISNSARVRGREHPITLHEIENYSHLLFLTGRVDQAERLTREILGIRERTLGPNDPQTISSVVNLSGVLMTLQRYDEAEPYYLRALSGNREIFGEDHPSTINALGNLGGFYRVVGRLDEAEPIYRETLESHLRILGERHHATLRWQHNMAYILWQLERTEESLPYQIAAFDGRVESLGFTHPETINAAFNLITFHREAGQIDPVLDRLTSIEQVGRSMDPVIRGRFAGFLALAAIEYLAQLDQPRSVIAHSAMGIALGLVEDIPDLADEYFADVYITAAKASITRGDHESAEYLLRTAHLKLEQTVGEDHPQTIRCQFAIEQLLAGNPIDQEV